MIMVSWFSVGFGVLVSTLGWAIIYMKHSSNTEFKRLQYENMKGY